MNLASYVSQALQHRTRGKASRGQEEDEEAPQLKYSQFSRFTHDLLPSSLKHWQILHSSRTSTPWSLPSSCISLRCCQFGCRSPESPGLEGAGGRCRARGSSLRDAAVPSSDSSAATATGRFSTNRRGKGNQTESPPKHRSLQREGAT